MGDATETSTGSLTLYTNKGCTNCHRIHITLSELGLAYKSVEIDLEKPRESWYLELNSVSASRFFF